MNTGVLFGMTMMALFEVMKSRFVASYGVEARNSLGYVTLVCSSLLLLFYTFPDWERCLT